MATNPYFNNFNSFSEQGLIEDLVIESIRMYGHDCYYCPRTIVDKDTTFGEDTLSTYNNAYFVEMYIRNVEGFEGEGDFLSKFGLQIRDSVTFTIANRVFNTEIGRNETIDRPQEGDLIYFPLNQKVFVITFVEHEPVFYQMGDLQMYDLRCELFEYSNGKLNTGISTIDDLEDEWSINVGINNLANTNANGDIIINETTGRPDSLSDDYSISENDTFEADADLILNFDDKNPFTDDGTF